MSGSPAEHAQPLFDLDTPEGLAKAVEWQTNLVASIAEHGWWIVPRTASIYTIYHAHKHVVRFGAKPDPQIDRVFHEMGWTVTNRSN